MSLTAATISATSISDDDRRRAEKFIAADQDSPLSVFLQNVLAATARGADIGLVADDAELSPNQAAELLKMSRPHLLSFSESSWLHVRPVRSSSPMRSVEAELRRTCRCRGPSRRSWTRFDLDYL